MQIVETTINPKKPTRILAYCIVIVLGLAGLRTVVSGFTSIPTGSYLSPLPQGELANTDTSTSPTPSLGPTFAQALNLAQNYLDKAYKLSQNQQQTDSDKKDIIFSLNKSLEQANIAINMSAKDPTGYLLRAQIMNAISIINPEATKLAQIDLETAQKLSNGQTVTLPKAVNPLELLHSDQASLAQNVIVATPQSPEATNSATQSQSNSSNGKFTIPAGQTELLIQNPLVNDQSYIYLINQSGSTNPVYLKSKEVGAFTVAPANPSKTDINIDYYIINQ